MATRYYHKGRKVSYEKIAHHKDNAANKYYEGDQYQGIKKDIKRANELWNMSVDEYVEQHPEFSKR